MSKAMRMPLDGILLLDKSSGWSSSQALKKAQYLCNARKAGHGGTLDPMATGLLPLMFGEATKFANDLLGADKTYLAQIRLGVTTDTGDAEGAILDRVAVEVNEPQWEQALASFRGDIEQIPPMYSALKHEGRPLYRYAREGTVLERAPRRVTIHALQTVRFDDQSPTVRVRCSKGTYVRTLAEDIGKKIGCGAHLQALRRERIAELDVADAITIDRLAGLEPAQRVQQLRPLDSLMQNLPTTILAPDLAARFAMGQRIRLGTSDKASSAAAQRVYADQASPDRLLGLARLEAGVLIPLRVLAGPASLASAAS